MKVVDWFDRLETEHDNLRAALAWSLSEEGGAETGLRLATALVIFWIRRGYIREGREWLTNAVARSGELPAPRRARVLFAAGAAALNQGDYAAARSLFEESLTLSRELVDKGQIALTLLRLAFAAFCQCDYPEAEALSEQSRMVFQDLGNASGVFRALNQLGHVARCQGNYGAARSYYEECLAFHRESGDTVAIAHCLHNLGHMARSEGNHGVAHALYTESLVRFQEERDKFALTYPLEGFAGLAAAAGKPRRAAHLWGASEALRESIFVSLAPTDRAMNAPYMEAARIALGDEAFAAAWAEGRAMTPEEAVRVALETPE
jgi:non-specific serine/threonine protein kinase